MDNERLEKINPKDNREIGLNEKSASVKRLTFGSIKSREIANVILFYQVRVTALNLLN